MKPAIAVALSFEIKISDLVGSLAALEGAAMKHLLLWSIFAVLIGGCERSSDEVTTQKLVRAWQMDKITDVIKLTAEQHLKKDGSFEMRGTLVVPGGSTKFVVQGTWRADSAHYYQTATNSEPNLGSPLNKEEMHVLTSVGSSKFSIHNSMDEVRTFRRKK
jgi:hypothetical protein